MVDLHGEVHRPARIVVGHHRQIIDDVIQQMCLTNGGADRLGVDVHKMHVQVIVGRLVVEKDAQLVTRHTVLLGDNFLKLTFYHK